MSVTKFGSDVIGFLALRCRRSGKLLDYGLPVRGWKVTVSRGPGNRLGAYCGEMIDIVRLPFGKLCVSRHPNPTNAVPLTGQLTISVAQPDKERGLFFFAREEQDP
jgi:hypothetical protein